MAVGETDVEARTVAIVGDSQAQGLMRPLTDELEGEGWTVLGGLVQPGAHSSRIAALVRQLLSALPMPPDVLIVAGGGNDADPRSSSAHWETIRRTARGAGVREVWWVGPPRAGSGREDLQRIRDRVSDALRVYWSPRFIDGRTTVPSDARDASGVHLTPEGYRRWAGIIAAVLSSPAPDLVVTDDVPDVPGAPEAPRRGPFGVVVPLRRARRRRRVVVPPRGSGSGSSS